MREFGIIGFPLTHSFSASYFNKKFERENINALFTAFELEDIHDFPQLLKANTGICGLSVTIPHKQTVIPFLDETDKAAAAIGAVNCISFRNGTSRGHNTDIYGFAESLRPLIMPHHTQALVLGTGGAAKAVCYVLAQWSMPFLQVSRKNSKHLLSYAELTPEIIGNHTLIINTTPVGMYPQIDACPSIPYDALTSNHLLFDLIYNPEETTFLQKGKEKGATIKNGLEMLHIQAERSWEIWNSL